MTPPAVDKPSEWIVFQRMLGQELFLPPNVAGWPGGKTWLRGSALNLRLQLPQSIYTEKRPEVLQLTKNEQDDEMNAMMAGDRGQKDNKNVYPNWSSFIKNFELKQKHELVSAIARYLLPYPLEPSQEKLISDAVTASTETDYIKQAAMLIMKMPEFQLC
jgi:hypothetical protein